jgi:fructose transport system substrate-binding protein
MGQLKRRLGRHWRSTSALAAAIATASAIAACGNSENEQSNASSAASEDVTVGLITKTAVNPFFVDMEKAAKAEAAKERITLLTAAGKFDGDSQSQITAIENMTTRGVKGILLTASDSEALVPTVQKARSAGVAVIALDSPLIPANASDGLFATDNTLAGELIGKWAKAKFAGKTMRIGMLDVVRSIKVGAERHDGFLKGLGIKEGDPSISGSADSKGDLSHGQSATEQLLQKDPNINLIFGVNEPAALGAVQALRAAGRKDVTVVAIDGGCGGVRAVKSGTIAATSQQYPKRMAEMGVKAITEFVKTGKKPSGYTNTGVELITDDPQGGLPSKDTGFGLENCWG